MTMLLILITSLLWSSLSLASDIYIVKPGNTLSGITRKLFRGHPIYGPQGKMRFLIDLNKITRPNFLLPGQNILYSDTSNSPEPALEFPEAPADTSPQVVFENNVDESFSSAGPEVPQEISQFEQKYLAEAQIGIKNLKVEQRKALGRGNTSGTYNDLKLNLELKRSLYKFGLNFDTYVYDHKQNGIDNSVRMNSFDLYVAYRSLFFGLSREQLPLLRNNAGTLEVTRQNLYSALLGYRKQIELSESLAVRLVPSLSLPLSSSASNSSIKLDQTSGYGAHFKIDLLKEIYKKNHRKINLSWSNQADYESISYHAKWNVSKGKSHSTLTSFSSVIGAKADF
jgi:hypothetical protein